MKPSPPQKKRIFSISKIITMKIYDLKTEILSLVNEADQELLKVIKKTIDTYASKVAVTYNIKGKSLNRKNYIARIKDSEEQIKKRKTISHAELKKNLNLGANNLEFKFKTHTLRNLGVLFKEKY